MDNHGGYFSSCALLCSVFGIADCRVLVREDCPGRHAGCSRRQDQRRSAIVLWMLCFPTRPPCAFICKRVTASCSAAPLTFCSMTSPRPTLKEPPKTTHKPRG